MPSNEVIPPTPSEADYRAAGPPPDDVAWFQARDPLALFLAWLEEASRAELNDPNAMALATVDATGLPDVRMVLLKDVDEGGFTFYSNGESAKGEQISAQPGAALCFHWKSLRRQVRVRGPVTLASDAEADAYFAERARHSQIGAWASAQSRPMESRAVLEAAIAEIDARFAGQPVTRPPFWRGYRVRPVQIEFWRDRPFRLHDRLVFTRTTPEAAWAPARLYP